MLVPNTCDLIQLIKRTKNDCVDVRFWRLGTVPARCKGYHSVFSFTLRLENTWLYQMKAQDDLILLDYTMIADVRFIVPPLAQCKLAHRPHNRQSAVSATQIRGT